MSSNGVWLYPDEQKTVYWQIATATPSQALPSVVEVEVGGVWNPAVLNDVKRIAALNICGAEVTPVPPGAVVIAADVLPRLRIDGKDIETDSWIRVRA